ncbi:hypothetical protein KIN20_011120 [Parelaphostrongylus tenuis]|uniref:Uncharacterized protein n=1 Tax=Parelaphostrongylus tenuis TaxID=148309 RepID=A0AAD5MRM4_PARTN|nr:hypothetical protein KIN20_011120 [Parelaphostrongylus tenuis]
MGHKDWQLIVHTILAERMLPLKSLQDFSLLQNENNSWDLETTKKSALVIPPFNQLLIFYLVNVIVLCRSNRNEKTENNFNLALELTRSLELLLKLSLPYSLLSFYTYRAFHLIRRFFSALE